MGVRHCRAAKIVGICLLLLAVSPVTAPFAVCDLPDLVAPSASDAGAKTAHDQKVLAVSPSPGACSAPPLRALASPRPLAGARICRAPDAPLRL